MAGATLAVYLCTRPKKPNEAPTAEPLQKTALAGPCAPVEPATKTSTTRSTATGGISMVFDMQDHENQPLHHGRDVDSSMNCTFCTTGTKTTLSNCNCEISMVRTMGISHGEKQGCQRPWRTATAEQGHLSLTNDGPTTTLSENCNMKRKSWTMGNCLCAQQECQDNPAPVVAQRQASTPLSKNCTSHKPMWTDVKCIHC